MCFIAALAKLQLKASAIHDWTVKVWKKKTSTAVPDFGKRAFSFFLCRSDSWGTTVVAVDRAGRAVAKWNYCCKYMTRSFAARPLAHRREDVSPRKHAFVHSWDRWTTCTLAQLAVLVQIERPAAIASCYMLWHRLCTRGMQGIVGRAWASFRKFITSLTLIVEPTEPQQRTDTRMRLLRIGATEPEASDGTWSVSHVHVHVHGSLTKHVWTLVLVGRHVRTRACWERQETRSDWMSCTLLMKITRPYYCIVHRYECTHQCGPCDNVHVHASWVFSCWSWSRSSPILKRNPIRPDVMHFLLAVDKRALHRYARNRRGSEALYCASVCAARCGGLRSTRSGQKKVQGWRKGAGSKIAVGPPIPIYIASDRIPSQHVGVGLAQARPN